jgi:hypothetical protein
MKKLYFAVTFLVVSALIACSKDFLKKYDERVIGTWRITDVDRRGLGGNISNLPFQEGVFNFADGGTLTYTDAANVNYLGNWDIIKKTIDGQLRRGLEITVANHTTQVVLSEYYDDLNFSGTNHFKTTIFSGAHSYITHFRR